MRCRAVQLRYHQKLPCRVIISYAANATCEYFNCTSARLARRLARRCAEGRVWRREGRSAAWLPHSRERRPSPCTLRSAAS